MRDTRITRSAFMSPPGPASVVVLEVGRLGCEQLLGGGGGGGAQLFAHHRTGEDGALVLERETGARPRSPVRPPAAKGVSRTVLRRVPSLLTSTSTTSPSVMKPGGSMKSPTPPGVPVTMTSPGESGVNVVTTR